MFPLLDVGILNSCSYRVWWKGWALGIGHRQRRVEPEGVAEEAENGENKQDKIGKANNERAGRGEIEKEVSTVLTRFCPTSDLYCTVIYWLQPRTPFSNQPHPQIDTNLYWINPWTVSRVPLPLPLPTAVSRLSCTGYTVFRTACSPGIGNVSNQPLFLHLSSAFDPKLRAPSVARLQLILIRETNKGKGEWGMRSRCQVRPK